MPGSPEIDCLPENGPCVKTIHDRDIRVTLDINPKPVKTMTDLVFTVDIRESGKPVTNADVMLDLTMPGMFMGMNRPQMKHKKDGVYEGKGVIPVCPHGGTVWKAEVTVKLDNKSETVNYVFEVNRGK
jgi:uncharacterized GH25 family protein